ncbi:MAG: hypothetical protein MHMPM18_002524 [Marteilia pararefringens]
MKRKSRNIVSRPKSYDLFLNEFEAFEYASDMSKQELVTFYDNLGKKTQLKEMNCK